MSNEILGKHFPDRSQCFYLPMKIGNSPKDADEGAALILAGTKTATSSAHWHYPDGRLPFVGALSVLLDGADSPRGVVETLRVELMEFGAIDAAFAEAYGEGRRTLDWWRHAMGEWYRNDAARHGQSFDERTVIICEWFKLVRVSEPAR